MASKNNSDMTPVVLPEESNQVATELRKSNRVAVGLMSTKILSDIDTLSEYHKRVLEELDQNHGVEKVRLNEIKVENIRSSTLSEIIKAFNELKEVSEPSGKIFKDVLTAVDRVSEDNRMILDKVRRLLEPSDTNEVTSLHSHRSRGNSSKSKSVSYHSLNNYSVPYRHHGTPSVRSYSSGSSHSSRRSSKSSFLQEMAIQSRVTIAEKETNLATEMETLRLEAEMAELEKQKEQMKRSIRAAKAHGELEAERRKHAVLLQAVEEEIQAEQASPLLQKPLISSQDIAPKHQLRHSDSSTPTPIEPQRQELPVIRLPHNQSIESRSSTRSEHVLLAEAIRDAIKETQVAPPQPFIFNGDLLRYTEWKTSFFDLVDKKRGEPKAKLALLRTYVSEDIAEQISGYCTLGTEDGYKQALSALDDEFGDLYQIAHAFTSKLDNWPTIQREDGNGLRRFVGFLNQCVSSMTRITTLQDLNGIKEMKRIIAKLPTYTQRSWIREATKFQESNGKMPQLADLCKFMKHEVKVACNPLNDNTLKEVSSKKEQRTERSRNKTSFNTVTVTTGEQGIKANRNEETCLYCEIPKHNAAACFKLIAQTPEEKERFIQSNRLCYSCLHPGHMSKDCGRKALCKKCNKPHPTSLHQDQFMPKYQEGTKVAKSYNPQVPEKLPQNDTEPTEAKKHVLTTHSYTNLTEDEGKSSMTVPVWLSSANHPQKEVLVYALLDSQSDSTYVDEAVVNELAPQKTETSINMSTMTSNESAIRCYTVENLRIRGCNSPTVTKMKTIYTSKRIPAVREHIPTPDMVAKWPHLKSVAKEMRQDTRNIPIGLLIGYDHKSVFMPYECISGGHDEPFAVKNQLGWLIMGVTGNERVHTKVTHLIASCDTTIDTPKQIKPIRLTQKVSKHKEEFSAVVKALEQDFIATQQQDQPSLSCDDRRFIDIVEKGIYKDEEGFITMPLPLRAQPKAVNSKAVAMHRFNLLKAKMEKDPTYKEQYYQFMSDVISRGEAEKVQQNSSNDRIWYLPHFGVYHPKKPGKIRVVFDASAKVGGTSLNDYLLEGPAHINNLQGILMRFRRERVAFMCDIEKMFHNFRVPPTDRDYLRFLWFDEHQAVTEYRMKVHLFGAKSSPGCATYGLRHLTRESSSSTEVTTFIEKDFYVDDGVTSVSSAMGAKHLIEGARQTCQSGNLRLHKFVSNRPEILENLPATEITERASSIDLCKDLNSAQLTERTLGLQWNIAEDIFTFQATDTEKPVTRRGILSTVASVYDPLGFISPWILQGKVILQSLCGDNLGWDTPLDQHTHQKWTRWINNMDQLKLVKIPRCHKPKGFHDIITAEIHNFSDASTLAYGQCSYLRLVDTRKQVHVSLIMSKARVAPLKVTSIPRLELQAACTSTDICTAIKRELQLTDLKEYYWTDSKVVLGYIKNEARRFHTYVANRVQKIRDASSTASWFYVPTGDNPADIASRGATPQQLMESTWFKGPAFLKHEMIVMPKQTNTELNTTDPEVKASTTILYTQITHASLHSRMSKFSRWDSAVTAVQKLQELVHRKQKITIDRISAKARAQTAILKAVQTEYYSDELIKLIRKQPLKKSSSILKLDPMLDEQGILRVGGRLQNSMLSFEEKHPIILPKASHVSSLITVFFHEQTSHQGRGLTLAKIRAAGYWMTGAHSKVASCIHHCVTCRKDRGKILEQKMASLPADRTESAPPFSYAGMDCFGPFIVKDGRKETKRWGLLMTCMASRAIHIELLEDMTTDSLLNALRCIVSIRGNIRQIRCDRGTNFIGAVSELSKHNKDLATEFVFNPPHASHMGGAWERHIRTVRNILKDISRKYGGRFSTSTLRTGFYEIMAVINCRPLSAVSEEDVPLTPNMLLTMKSDVTLPPAGKFLDSDSYSRKRWIQVQSIASQFWHRYRKEYLCQLQTRDKWTKPTRNLMVGDIVSVNEGDCMRNDWKIAKVIECRTSTDGLVRSVKLRIGNGTPTGKPVHLERPITKLILLVEAE